jgi:glycosyltransferase involved in cell wall biosynthesis
MSVTCTSSISAAFPAPSSSKSGWPWTVETKPLADVSTDGERWPKISIVTPSYNQGQFLEETIRSVLLQNYPNLEYIILDGGSTDNSAEIIKKYENYLFYWASEKDKGQADAIYRGFEMATGEILAYINSDDYYLPGTFQKVAEIFVKREDNHLLIGSCYYADIAGRYVRKHYGFPQNFASILHIGMRFGQPACFWRRDTFFSLGGFDRDMRFCFDADLFLKIMKKYAPTYTFRSLSVYRSHPTTKGSTLKSVLRDESEYLKNKYGYYSTGCATRVMIEQISYALFYFFRFLGRLYDAWHEPAWLFKEIKQKCKKWR